MKYTSTQPMHTDTALTSAMGSLTQKIDHLTSAHGNEPTTAYTSLSIYRHETPTELTGYLQEPSLCLIAQGKKRVLLGDEGYFYDGEHYLVTSIDLPLVAQILEASREHPYLGLTLRLEKKQIAQMMIESHQSISRKQPGGRGLAVSRIEEPIVWALLRLIDLLESPEDILFLPHSSKGNFSIACSPVSRARVCARSQ